MNRVELVRRFVLNEVSDDYEEIGLITEHLARDGAKCGVSMDRDDVIQALAGLVQSGLAAAWRFTSKRSPEAIEGMPTPADMKEDHCCYFYITDSGMQLQRSDGSWYPFDDDGELRKGWTPPVE